MKSKAEHLIFNVSHTQRILNLDQEKEREREDTKQNSSRKCLMSKEGDKEKKVHEGRKESDRYF